MIHNDLKCDNILIGDDGRAKLIDFDLSSIPDVVETQVDVKRMRALHWKSPKYLSVTDKIPALQELRLLGYMCLLGVSSLYELLSANRTIRVLKMYHSSMTKIMGERSCHSARTHQEQLSGSTAAVAFSAEMQTGVSECCRQAHERRQCEFVAAVADFRVCGVRVRASCDPGVRQRPWPLEALVAVTGM